MRKNDHKTVNKTYINTLECTTLSYSHGYFCSFFIELNALASGTMTSGTQLSESEWQSDWESLSTSPLLALFTCCWMSFKAVLGNKEFEFVVSEMTLTAVTRGSASGYGISVLVSVIGCVHLIPLFKNSSGNSCNYCINNVQTLGLRVYNRYIHEEVISLSIYLYFSIHRTYKIFFKLHEIINKHVLAYVCYYSFFFNEILMIHVFFKGTNIF